MCVKDAIIDECESLRNEAEPSVVNRTSDRALYALVAYNILLYKCSNYTSLCIFRDFNLIFLIVVHIHFVLGTLYEDVLLIAGL